MGLETATAYLELDDEEIQVEIKFSYWPASRGSRDKYGLALEPDTPAEIEITEVRRFGDESINGILELPPDVIKELEQHVWDALEDRPFERDYERELDQDLD